VQSQKSYKQVVPIKGHPKAVAVDNFSQIFSEVSSSIRKSIDMGITIFQKQVFDSTSSFQGNQQKLVSFL
jgi:predicted DNA-binding protein (UPF0278 family)